MQIIYSFIFITLIVLIPSISSSNSDRYYKNICKSSRIPVKKVIGKDPDYIRLAFTGDTQFARKIEKTMKKKFHSNY